MSSFPSKDIERPSKRPKEKPNSPNLLRFVACSPTHSLPYQIHYHIVQTLIKA
ncbi:hypothetical protein COCC4DRAFT_31506 [Bipolaris maydis ATCC 48331]|uniref:Uncharacterized protein n=2 Tax=Cochliobolus heterostrophus TaxID=5016 RepID=M2TI83_COCH5|nr:uncharacterized protein COCC4DRAFT_31506 [Bipolaris maydis ATCC 48331]EMD86214.1 hypothetical protein COCHEDRAFT_1023961 [Bipolaris maydis C5]ENI06162.1 hypothetical protein COCC4DRAFT_31506 [Bipolaris maydis ATCC 48331]